MKVSSSAFREGEKIPTKYTCDGDDVSPPLKISDIPPETQALAIVMDDPDAPGGVFDHWVIWNIPPDTGEIPEHVPNQEKVDSMGGALQGKNGMGNVGYGGPCPPSGPGHNYRFKVFALDKGLDLNPGIRRIDLEREMDEYFIERDEITVTYSR